MRLESEGFRGWHGFDLETTPLGCRVTYTIEAEPSLPGVVFWHVFVVPVHDWFIEAIFDRIEEALRTGEMPTVTRRKMPWRAATSFALLDRVSRTRRRGQRLRPSPTKA
jgi:hypothetical protein